MKKLNMEFLFRKIGSTNLSLWGKLLKNHKDLFSTDSSHVILME